MSKAGYCQHDAGVLDNDELSDIAKKRFVDDVLKELRLGSSAVKHPLFPVNLNLPPQPSMANVPLDDPKAFPDFHKNVLGQYRDIARALDAKSRYTFLPICCPVSLAVSLGADVPKLRFPDEFLVYGFALPLLAIKLGFPMPLDLAQKLPSLLGLPIPDLQLPKLDFDPKALPDLMAFKSSLLGVPPALITAALELLTKMPQLAIGVLSLDLSVFYDVIVGSKMFGNFDPSSALVWMVAQKVLAIRVAECILFYVIGTTMGSSAGGIVGGLSQIMGYVPPPPPSSRSKGPREKAVSAAKVAEGQSLERDEKEAIKPNGQSRYAGFLLPQEIDDGSTSRVNATIKVLNNRPAGPLFARAVLFRVGANTDFFSKRLDLNTDTVALLRDEVRRVGALRDVTETTLPLEVGNIVVCDQVSLVVTSRDGDAVKGIMAGLTDSSGRAAVILSRDVKITKESTSYFIIDGTQRHQIRYVVDVMAYEEKD